MYSASRHYLFSSIAILALSVVINSVWAGDYSFKILDAPAAKSGTKAYGINDNGQVVGVFLESPTISHGFLFDSDNFTTLDVPSAIAGYSYAIGINNNKRIVGYYYDAKSSHTFIYDGAQFSELNATSLSTSKIFGILGNAINAKNQIAGTFFDQNGSHGYLYANDKFTVIDAPSSVKASTTVTGLNDNTDLVGYFSDGQGSNRGFLKRGTEFSTLDVPNIDQKNGGTFALGINNAGTIVGNFYDNTGSHGFVYNAGNFKTVDAPNASRGTTVSGLNNHDQLVGWYTDDQGLTHAFIATPNLTNNPATVGNVTPPVISPAPTTCKINTQYFPASKEVTFEDVEFNGKHFWAKLKDQGGLKFLVTDYREVAAGTCSDAMLVHFKDGIVSIPNVQVSSDTYQVFLQQVDTRLLFEVKTSVKLN